MEVDLSTARSVCPGVFLDLVKSVKRGMTEMSIPHLDEEVLDRYAMGTLPQESIPGVEEHILSCPFCQARLVETDEFLIHFRAAATQIDAHRDVYWRRFFRLRRPIWSIPAVIAAALALLIISPRHAKPQPAVLLLQSLRGPESRALMSSKRPYLMTFDLFVDSAQTDYEVEIVDDVGKVILEAHAQLAQNHLTVLVNKLEPGVYWVRVYRMQAVRELMEEYGLQVE